MRIATLRVAAAILLATAACSDSGTESPAAGSETGAPGPVPAKVVDIPDKTVVLTFDDAVRNHLEYVAPLLEEYGFGATFFVSAYWMEDEDRYLTWREVAELHRRGFEIGNHTWSHRGCNSRRAAEFMPGDVRRIEWALEEVGVPSPISFAWPGGAFGSEGRKVLSDMGFRLARRGHFPERKSQSLEPGPPYDPTKHDPLLIPTTGVAHRTWSLAHLEKLLTLAKDGKAVVLMFHGVPDPTNEDLSTPPDRLREYLACMKRNGYRGIAMRDLLPYLEGRPLPSDPLTWIRYPDEE